MAESADASDLKSDDGDIVWVRPPLALLQKKQIPEENTPGDHFLIHPILLIRITFLAYFLPA